MWPLRNKENHIEADRKKIREHLGEDWKVDPRSSWVTLEYTTEGMIEEAGVELADWWVLYRMADIIHVLTQIATDAGYKDVVVRIGGRVYSA